MRRVAAIVLAINCSLVSLSADLKYTMAVTARPSTGAATAPSNPIFGLLGPMVVNTIAPPGGVQVTTTIGERASRFEYRQGVHDHPRGGRAHCGDGWDDDRPESSRADVLEDGEARGIRCECRSAGRQGGADRGVRDDRRRSRGACDD